MYNIDSRFCFFDFRFFVFSVFLLDRHGPSVPTYLPQPRDYISSSYSPSIHIHVYSFR